MISLPELDYSDKDRFYDDLRLSAKGLVLDESDRIANFANLAALIYHSLPDINWAGFYLLKNGELVVGPFQGKPACVRIRLGEGVCGTAAKDLKTLVVDDVEEFPGHIACDAASRSEIVIPLLRDQQLIGVLDIDAPLPARFDDQDRKGLEAVAEILP
ncbi:GAF domain-containing protein [Natronospira proteinivora]|uniref:GAF domain-containing protein n=1 Tax=Natronospira proteinivora TaxID=1807133 RepID=A0ABT1G9Z6_9GAMM|nr:GAF domain-containing protein [Natronospira proteinivora]MCP1727113.1 GAF domain-containing protein [Natronospira proteinivora]